MRVTCLYCDVENDALETSGYCDNCGKKLPNSAMIRTRKAILTGNEGEPLITPLARSRISGALFTTAVVQLACGGLFLVLGPAILQPVAPTFLTTVLSWTIIPTLGLAVMGLWARSQARSAALLSLALYSVWMLIGFLAQPDFATGWLLVHAVIVGLLVWVGWMAFHS